MRDTRKDLTRILKRFAPSEGYLPTPIPGVHCINISKAKPREKRHWHTCLGIVAQGCKEIVLGAEVYLCNHGHYTATPIDLPVISRVSSASIEKPFLCLLIHIDPIILSEVAAQFDHDMGKDSYDGQQALFVGKADEQMLQASLRLAKLFQTPDDARVLGPLIVKELFYHLLKSENGESLRQFARSGSKMHRVSHAIHKLRSELSEDVDVAALAKSASMSRSAFFKHFKDITSVSPIQYQKKLRLLEAKRLMTEENETAESSAYRVGYKSASQFSREYSRLFGNAPLRDATKSKKNAQTVSL